MSLASGPHTVEVLAILTPLFVVTGNARLLQEQLVDDGLSIVNGSRRRLNAKDATFLTRSHLGRPYFADLISHLTSGPLILMHLQGYDPIAVIHRLARHADSILETHPLGTRDSRAQHALYCSNSPHDAIQDLMYVGFTAEHSRSQALTSNRLDISHRTLSVPDASRLSSTTNLSISTPRSHRLNARALHLTTNQTSVRP